MSNEKSVRNGISKHLFINLANASYALTSILSYLVDKHQDDIIYCDEDSIQHSRDIVTKLEIITYDSFAELGHVLFKPSSKNQIINN